LDISGLNISKETLRELFHVDKEKWRQEVEEMKDFTKQFGDRLPEGIKKEMNALQQRLV